MINVDIRDSSKYKAALEEIYKRHVSEGHRFYWDIETDEKVNPITGAEEYLNPKELALQTGWTVLKASVMLLSNCIGLLDDTARSLSKNSELQSDDISEEQVGELIEKLSALNKMLVDTEVRRAEYKATNNGAIADDTVQDVQYNIDDDFFVEIINALPKNYFIKWIMYTIDVNVLPFKHEMKRVRDED